VVTFSYTQIAQYLRCPRSYRHRYLDGWREKDLRATLLFGRCFEKALAAFFSGEDSTAALFKEWGAYQDTQLEYSRGDDWDHMLRQGIRLLERLAQDDRIRINQPQDNMQVKLVRSLSGANDFISYIDAVGTLDGKRCLLEWKTTTARYPEQPNGLLALDPQLICYSWISGIADATVVAFVRKRSPEIQYLKTTITDETAAGIGIRFPQNGCVSCAELGLCLGNQQLVDAKLIRLPGASDLDWLEHFDD
jgi:PD-(D/E)XK nuclease superfamily